MQRRDFMKTGLLGVPAIALAQLPQQHATVHAVAAGTDLSGESKTLGFSRIAFKVPSTDTGGELFVMEHSNLTKGGPFRHIHPEQDEWLYALEGEFRVEVGEQKLVLKPGDSVLMPRKVPHVWAQVQETPGKLLIAFTPAGRMEDFYRDFGKTGKLPADANAAKPYGLERVGPPLAI